MGRGGPADDRHDADDHAAGGNGRFHPATAAMGDGLAVHRYDGGHGQRPDIPTLLAEAHGLGCAVDLADVTYYVGHETVTPRDDARALPRWVEALFAFMQRNASHLTDYFRLPPNQVVEIGRQVAI